MPVEVVPGIYLLKIPIPDNPLGDLNSYIIQGNNSDRVLIDTGWNAPQAFDALQKHLEELGVRFGDITQIVVTHSHFDHYGLADKLKQLSGAEVALHQADKDFIQLIQSHLDNLSEFLKELSGWLRLNGLPDREILFFQGLASHFLKEFDSLILPDRTLSGGERISVGDFNFEVIWTPGHSPGHVCLYEPGKKILLAGDHVLPTITPNVSFSDLYGSPLEDYVNSLRALEPLEVDLVLPAHEYVFAGLQERIGEILYHHEERERAILQVVMEKPGTTYEISSQIPWTGLNGVTVFWKDLDIENRWLALTETLAHLEFLKSRDEVEKTPTEDTAFHWDLKRG